MLIKYIALLLGMSCVFPVSASEPGQPLSYEDWLMDLPGLSLHVVAPFEEQGGPSWCERSEFFCRPMSGDNVGADGSAYYVPTSATLTDVCGEGYRCLRLEIRRVTPSKQIETVAYVEERRSDPDDVLDLAGAVSLWVDPANGFLWVLWTPYCQEDNDGIPDCQYAPGKELFRIEGLTTTFEVLQTYTPVSTAIGFRVPYMPEGFQFADWFDTYYGDLATVGDWSQAHPLQCGYPASAPAVGDYLTVEDTLPTPSPGQGYYYVTAATYQSQTRYGRRSIGGTLMGRDPAVLPACD